MQPVPLTTVWGLILYGVAGLALTLAVSGAVYRWLEQPMIRFGRSLTRRWLPQPI